MLVQQEKYPSAMKLDIGGKLFEAIKNSNRTYLDMPEFVKTVEQWYKDQGRPFTSEMKGGLTEVFNLIDKDKSGTITKKEIFDQLFKELDLNGDGVWNITEVKDFMRQYAQMLHRNLKDGWEEQIEKGFAEINNGVSAHELEAALSADGHMDISSFKKFIMENSKPLPKGLLDAFEIMEDILMAMGDDEHDELTSEQFLEIMKDYVTSKHHEWNDTTAADIKQWFDHMNTNNDSSLSKKEIFHHIFTWFDHNGDGHVNDTEIKNMYIGYAQVLKRKLNDGWWVNHVEPAIRHIESGVSPEELWKYLEKTNGKITDFRNAVIALSDPSSGHGGNEGGNSDGGSSDGSAAADDGAAAGE